MSYPQIVRNPEGGFLTLIGPNMTDDGRTVYGYKWKTVEKLAARWWAKSGQAEMRRLHHEFRDPDVGVDSGVTLARDWEHLTSDERVKVTHVYEEQHLRARDDVREALLQYMIDNHPETLNQAELGKYLASLPDAEKRVANLLKIGGQNG